MDDFDAIVIGSGIGGLTAASLLAQLTDRRVLVLERHFRLGGFTHEFQRRGYRWDVGVHYIGGMAPGRTSRRLIDLVTGGGDPAAAVAWDPMPADFEVFHYPDLEFTVPDRPEEYAARLTQVFPHESAGIARYFEDVRRAATWYGRNAWGWSAGGVLGLGLDVANARGKRLGTMTTADYLRRHLTDPRLRALLVSQWGDYGLPPERSAFGMHALLVAHYLDGGWFPRGGSEAIAVACQRVIEARGGSCRINHEVEEILVEDGQAVGVRAHVKKGRGGSEAVFRAPLVVSDAGAHTTYCRLLPAGTADDLRARVEAAEPSGSTVTLYLGLKESPARLGFRGENHWFYDSFDHDATAADTGAVLEGRPHGAYLSFPSLKDTEATRHTAEIIAFVGHDAFARWEGSTWMRRGEEYDALKARISRGLLDLVERRYPGFGELVDHTELSTPLTVTDFTGHRAGGIYGLASTPDRLRGELVAARSPVPGLLIAGADACAPGLMGALMGGVFAVGAVLGPAGYLDVLKAARDAPATTDPAPVATTG